MTRYITISPAGPECNAIVSNDEEPGAACYWTLIGCGPDDEQNAQAKMIADALTATLKPQGVEPVGYRHLYPNAFGWPSWRFETNGREINGSKPIRKEPLYAHPQAVADAPSQTPTCFECDAELSTLCLACNPLAPSQTSGEDVETWDRQGDALFSYTQDGWRRGEPVLVNRIWVRVDHDQRFATAAEATAVLDRIEAALSTQPTPTQAVGDVAEQAWRLFGEWFDAAADALHGDTDEADMTTWTEWFGEGLNVAQAVERYQALSALAAPKGEEEQGLSLSVAESAAIPQEARPADAEPSGWRPIETAPKDGTWFLAYGDGQEWDDCTFVCEWSGDEWRQVPGDLDAAPVCWMPLPEPPTPSGGQAVVPDPTGLVRDEPSPKAPAKLEGES